MRRMIYLLFAVILGSCAESTIYYCDILRTYDVDKLLMINPINNIGIYDNMIFYWSEENDYLLLNFKDLSKNIKKSISFEKGKGPGEISSINQTKVTEKKIIIFDSTRKLLQFYDLEGQFIDEFQIKNFEIGSMFDILENTLYVTGMLKNQVTKIDLKKNIIKKVPFKVQYKKIADLEKKGFRISPIHIDRKTKNVYISSYILPYEINIYNNDLDNIGKLKRKIEKTLYHKFIYNKVGASGSIMVSNMLSDDQYLYVSFGGGIDKEIRNKKVVVTGIPNDYFISIFNMKNNRYVGEIRISNFSKLNGMAYLVNVSEKIIDVLIIDFGKPLSTNNDNKNYRVEILKLNNPLYNHEY